MIRSRIFPAFSLETRLLLACSLPINLANSKATFWESLTKFLSEVFHHAFILGSCDRENVVGIVAGTTGDFESTCRGEIFSKGGDRNVLWIETTLFLHFATFRPTAICDGH